MEELKFPIGKFSFEKEVSQDEIDSLISQIDNLPELLRANVQKLGEGHLDSQYRPGGWTIRQLIHHIADSHMNAYIRFKLALTEDKPTVKTFQEALWAELEDNRLPVDISLNLIEALHRRWVALVRSLSSADLEREFYHPEVGTLTLKKVLGLYAWHGNHHLAHLTSYIKRMNLD